MSFVDCEGFETINNNDVKETLIGVSNNYITSSDPQITAFGYGTAYGKNVGGAEDTFSCYFPGLVNKKTIFFNWHLKGNSTTASTNMHLTLLDGASTQVVLRRNGDNSFSALRGSTVLATSSPIITVTKYYFLQLKVVIDSTNGEFIFKVDNSTVFNLTGINTQNTANDYVNRYTFLVLSNFNFIDNVVVYDDAGTQMNDFTPETRVFGQFPTANGDINEFTPNTSTNFSRVNQRYDGDTTYNFTDTVGHTDLYAYNALVPSGSAVYGVKTSIFFRKSDLGDNEVVNVVKSGGTIYEDPAGPYESSPSYIIKEWIMEKNPNTNDFWTVSGANSLQTGIRRKL
jgi:hypothetical protein